VRRVVESFYVGGYWGARPESMEECAQRIQSLMQSLQAVDPLLANWFEKGLSRKAALTSRVEPRTDHLWDLLLDGRNRADFGGTVIQDLGFRLGLWNGQEAAVGFSIHCGAWSPRTGSSNSVVIDLPEVDHADAASLYQPAAALSMIRSVVRAWDPSYVTWVNYPMSEAQRPELGDVVIGWATYLSEERTARAGRLPRDVQTENCGDGLIVIIGDDPTDVPLDAVMAVRDALGPALLPDLF
jgi:hypothetical protein